MMEDLGASLPAWALTAAGWVLPVLLAVTLHEAAHGYAASLLGDQTARQAGRLSLNPLRHIDPVGTILLPAILLLTKAGFLFGWAKPVPVDLRNLRQPRRAMIWVALAGPGANLAQAIIAALLLHAIVGAERTTVSEILFANLVNAIQFNLVLAVFNMIPLPPLDGGRVLVGVLPLPLAVRVARLERFGMLLLIGVMFLLPMLGREIGMNLNVVGWVVGVPVDVLTWVLLTATGH